MNLPMQFKDYLALLQRDVNQPLMLSRALIPFGVVGVPNGSDPYLLFGHLLDGLSEEFLEVEMIDASDVLRVAEDLGVQL